MKFIFLTKDFYNDHSHCTEIEKKETRPYSQVCLDINGITFAIPLRSNIHHEHVFWTNKEENCGLDFSKAVIITNDHYIDTLNSPRIRENEFKKLKGQDYNVQRKLSQYIRKYKKAKLYPDKPRNATLCKYSTLQYFEEYLSEIP